RACRLAYRGRSRGPRGYPRIIVCGGTYRMSTRPSGMFVRAALTGALLATAVGTGGASIAVAQDASEAAAPLTFGMILVGPQDDRGWSQAHREAGEYLEE